MKQKFLDHVSITLFSGRGGKGAVHFQSNARSPRGGPDGGDGGDGGDVFLKTAERLRDLALFNRSFYKAEDGKPGGGGKRKGAKGKNLVFCLPPHTACYDQEGQLLYPTQSHKQDKAFLLLKGGKGGKGNAFFKSARRQAPRKAQEGKPSHEKQITLEMKWRSHLALIGLKGVGKSQLLANLHAYLKDQRTKPPLSLKKAYAFTAYPRLLALNQAKIKSDKISMKGLGVLEPLWVVDLPGLNKSNKNFLRQAEKAQVLLFVVSLEDKNPFLSYQSLINILHSYDKEQNKALLKKPKCLILKGEKTEDNIKKEKLFKEVKRISFFVENSKEDMKKVFAFLNKY